MVTKEEVEQVQAEAVSGEEEEPVDIKKEEEVEFEHEAVFEEGVDDVKDIPEDKVKEYGL